MANFFSRVWNWTSRILSTSRLVSGWTWLGDAGDVDAGVVVSREDAMEIAAYLAIFNALAWDVSQVPLRTYERLDNGDHRDADFTPAGRPWRLGPNAWQTTPLFLGQVMLHLQSVGDYGARTGYVAGVLDELYPVEDPTAIAPRIERGQRFCHYDGQDYRATGERPEFFFLHVPSFSGYYGQDFLATERQTLGLARALCRTGAKFFANGATPGVMLIVPASVKKDDIATIKAAFKASYGGASAWDPFVAHTGTELKQLSVDMEKAQMLQTRQQVNKEICSLRRYPYWRLHQETAPTLEARRGYWVETVRPWLVLIRDAINKHLVRPPLFVDFDFDVLLEADMKTRYEAYNLGISGLWLRRNEARRGEGLASLGPEGDRIVAPNNVTDSTLNP